MFAQQFRGVQLFYWFWVWQDWEPAHVKRSTPIKIGNWCETSLKLSHCCSPLHPRKCALFVPWWVPHSFFGLSHAKLGPSPWFSANHPWQMIIDWIAITERLFGNEGKHPETNSQLHGCGTRKSHRRLLPNQVCRRTILPEPGEQLGHFQFVRVNSLSRPKRKSRSTSTDSSALPATERLSWVGGGNISQFNRSIRSGASFNGL